MEENVSFFCVSNNYFCNCFQENLQSFLIFYKRNYFLSLVHDQILIIWFLFNYKN